MVDKLQPDVQISAARPEVTPVISLQLFENILASFSSLNKIVLISLIPPGEHFTSYELASALMRVQSEDGWDLSEGGVRSTLLTFKDIGAIVSVDTRKASPEEQDLEGLVLKHRRPFDPDNPGRTTAYIPVLLGEQVSRTLYSLSPIGEQFRWIAGSLGSFYQRHADFFRQGEIDLAQYSGSIHTKAKPELVSTREGDLTYAHRQPGKRLALLSILTGVGPGTKLSTEDVRQQLQENKDNFYYLVGSMLNEHLLFASHFHPSEARIYGLKQGFDIANCLAYLDSAYFGRRRMKSDAGVPAEFLALDQLTGQIHYDARLSWAIIGRLIRTAIQAGGAFTWQDYVSTYYTVNPEIAQSPENIEVVRSAMYKLAQDSELGMLECVECEDSFLWLDAVQAEVHSDYVRTARAIQLQDPEEMQRGYYFFEQLQTDKLLTTEFMRQARETSRHYNILTDELIATEVLAILQAAAQPLDTFAIVDALRTRLGEKILPKDFALAKRVRAVLKAQQAGVFTHFDPHRKPRYHYSLSCDYQPDEP